MTSCLQISPTTFRILIAVILTLRLQAVRLHADEPPATIAVVNGNSITENDLEFLYRSRDVRQELRSSVRERYIEQLIDRSLLKEFLRIRKIKAPESVVKERVARAEKLISQEGLNFDESLRNLGYTRESFAEEVALPLAWLAHARLAISETAIAEYWKTHQSKFDGTEVRAAHIVKRLPRDAEGPDKTKLSEQLAAIRQSILDGKTTFSKAAAENSDSPSGKEGGDLGQFAFRGRMPQDLTKVAFRLKVGEISEPFETPFGVHILTVTEVIPGDLSLEDARGEIFQELSGKLQAGLISQLRDKATISIPGKEPAAK
ncbi:MAG: peptidylprolyl isomerase [Rhodopirellula sp.]|nr:peptidylprolyl isomerase [Rhodopirellula sp.]